MLQKFHCEHVLKELKEIGRYQKTLLFVFIMPMAILTAFQSTFVYNELLPDHWCRVPLLANFSYGEQHRLIRPRIKFDVDGDQDDKILMMMQLAAIPIPLSNCEMFDIDYEQAILGLRIPTTNNKNNSNSSPPFFIPIKKCSKKDGWVYDQREIKENAATHYNFVCDRRNQIQIIGLVRKLSSALFSLIYAIFSDKYGRKIGILLILVVYVLSAISPVLTTNYYAFLACQALNGSTWPIGIIIVLVLGIEFVTPEYRSDVLALAGLSYHFGEWFAFFLSQTLPHWVWLSIGHTVFTIPYFLFYHYCDESPQWLLANKRFNKLKDLFEKINKVNRAELDQIQIKSIISRFTHYYNYDRCEEVSMAISMQNLNMQSTQGNILDKYERFRLRNSKSCDSFLSDDNDGTDGQDDDGKPSVMKKIKLFIKRSTLFQMIFLWAIVMMTNELTIDFMNKRKNRFDDNLLIDRFLGSLIKMPIILLTWYLVNQCFGRRWSNCIILSLNLMLLMLILFGQSYIKNIVWLNVSLSVLGIMLAECSELITILQTLELTSTRYRVIVASIVHCLSQSFVSVIIYWLYNHNLRIIFNAHTKLIFISTIHALSIIISSFVTETKNEYLPMGALESEQLITNFNYWSVAKQQSDILPSNLFLSLSKWDINANHQVVGSIKHLEKFTDS